MRSGTSIGLAQLGDRKEPTRRETREQRGIQPRVSEHVADHEVDGIASGNPVIKIYRFKSAHLGHAGFGRELLRETDGDW